MTEKNDSDDDELSKDEAEARERYFAACAALEALDDETLDTVIIEELRRQSVDPPPGLLRAVYAGIHVLLDVELADKWWDPIQRLAKKIAAIGRGETGRGGEDSAKLREIQGMIDILGDWNFTAKGHAKRLCEMLEARFPDNNIDREGVLRAFETHGSPPKGSLPRDRNAARRLSVIGTAVGIKNADVENCRQAIETEPRKRRRTSKQVS